MRLEYYKKLPETMPEEELYKLFSGIIIDFNDRKVNKNEFLDILIELMERQVLTYEFLKEPLKTKLDNLLCNLWNTKNYNDVDVMLSLLYIHYNGEQPATFLAERKAPLLELNYCTDNLAD